MFRRLALPIAFAAAAFSGAALADGVYPRTLLKNHPKLAHEYSDVVSSIVAAHPWAAAGKGKETPVSRVSFGGHQYAVLSSCEPQDCSAQSVVVLVQPSADQAVGALVVNQGAAGLGPKRSEITWLGTPGQDQRRFMSAYLFR